MKLEKGQVLYVGSKTYVDEVPDKVAIKLGIMKSEPKKKDVKSDDKSSGNS